MIKEQKKSEALEKLAQPLPGIPDPKPAPNLDWNGVPVGTVTVTAPEKKARKPRTPRVEKPPRKKAQGTYAVLTEGQVKMAGEGEGGGPLIRLVFVPSDVGTFRGRREADEYALGLAKAKPGTVVAVVRMLGRVSVQTVSTVKLVRG